MVMIKATVGKLAMTEVHYSPFTSIIHSYQLSYFSSRSGDNDLMQGNFTGIVTQQMEDSFINAYQM